MSGQLTDKFMDQLKQWIGTGPKKFDLLYSITRDGCNSTTFHQKCDNQGPTVTLLYNQQGSIYGGYTKLSWTSEGVFGNDSTAFMFRLQYNGSETVNKFSCIKPQTAIYMNTNYGPTFGGGHDLSTFMGIITKTGSYYPLNGYTNMNHTYNSQGIGTDQINNGTMNVTELEVYRVSGLLDLKAVNSLMRTAKYGKRTPTLDKSLDGKRTPTLVKPWRDTPDWNMEFLESLMLDVENFCPPRVVQVPQSKILILGPVGAGKSSFFNTIASVFRGHVTGQAPSGCAEHSITSKYRMYQVRSSSSGKPLNFRLCDTQGLEEGQGIDAHDIVYLLDGNVPDGYQFNSSVPISPEIPDFKKMTQLKDKIHCVCIVIDGSTAGVLPDKMLEKIKSIQTKMHIRCVPQLVLMTKVDKICPQVEADTSKVFKSPAVLEQVNKVSQLLGIPRSHVLPVKNYEAEIDVTDNVNILALVTLRQILRATEDYMFNFLDEADGNANNANGLTAKD